MPGHSVWSLSLSFPHHILYERLLSPIHATWSIYFILQHFFTQIIFGEEYKLWRSSLCSLIHYPVTSSLLDPNFPQYPIPKYHQLMFLPRYGRPNFTLIWNSRHTYSSVYFNHHIFEYQTGREMILHLMITTIPRLQTALNFFQNVAFICYSSQIFKMFHTLKEFVTWIHSVILLCMINIYLIISAFISRPISLLAMKPHAQKER